ncbi:hypothetical protein SAMN04487897_1687 [Paenibacillus sp. yr247]|nr:hypothetical protein SAMN04487897_1687 [Paenibacillus sp. yr247]
MGLRLRRTAHSRRTIGFQSIAFTYEWFRTIFRGGVRTSENWRSLDNSSSILSLNRKNTPFFLGIFYFAGKTIKNSEEMTVTPLMVLGLRKISPRYL